MGMPPAQREAMTTPRTENQKRIDECQQDEMEEMAEQFALELDEAERVLLKINQALLPDPHDERDVSAEWQVKAIRAAIAAKGEA